MAAASSCSEDDRDESLGHPDRIEVECTTADGDFRLRPSRLLAR
jgi:hypothetical protein